MWKVTTRVQDCNELEQAIAVKQMPIYLCLIPEIFNTPSVAVKPVMVARAAATLPCNLAIIAAAVNHVLLGLYRAHIAIGHCIPGEE